MHQLLKRIVFSVLFLLPFLPALGQGGYYMAPYLWQNLQKVTLENPLTFLDYPYSSPYLDLRDFIVRNPEVGGRIPEYVEVKPPADVDLAELYYSVAYISSPDGVNGVLVLFFIADYDSDHPTLYIDANLNRDFRDDGDPVVFKKDRQVVNVRLKHDAEKSIAFYFSIVGPILSETEKPKALKEPAEMEPQSQIKRKKVLRPPSWLSFNFDVGYALGRVTYAYQNLSTGYPVNYTVTSNHKGFRAGLGVHLRDFRISATAGFNHFFYWTSYKTVRLGDPFYFCDPQCTRFENVEELRNRDIHPEIRWDFGAQISWEPFLTDDIRLGPFIEPQVWVYSGGVYQEKVLRDVVSYEFGPDPALRMGLSFWVRAGKQSYFRMEFSAAFSRFQPKGFFDAYNRLDDQQRSLGLHLGYGF